MDFVATAVGAVVLEVCFGVVVGQLRWAVAAF